MISNATRNKIAEKAQALMSLSDSLTSAAHADSAEDLMKMIEARLSSMPMILREIHGLAKKDIDEAKKLAG